MTIKQDISKHASGDLVGLLLRMRFHKIMQMKTHLFLKLNIVTHMLRLDSKVRKNYIYLSPQRQRISKKTLKWTPHITFQKPIAARLEKTMYPVYRIYRVIQNTVAAYRLISKICKPLCGRPFSTAA
jgi:hypothetical protein